MIFNTYWFVLSSAVFITIFWLCKNTKIRSCILLLFCFVFHTHFAGPAGVLPIIALGLMTYITARSQNQRACSLSIFICVLALCAYKYTHFLSLQCIALFWPSAGKFADDAATKFLPHAPLAISFFSFEFVHYLVEVKKGRKPMRSLADFAQFVFFFPSLVAGPIKRYEQFLPALKHGIMHASSADAATGFLRVSVGFFKKVVIADNLTTFINFHGPHFAHLALSQRWLLIVFIALRIYLDFSGYTDMALGFAQMMGIKLPANFHWPYLAKNIRDFWQRWHISLSSWIRDYVYIPLGGGKHGTERKIANGLIAFALCGLWHGPAWNFVAWGIYNGLGLAFSSSYRRLFGPAGKFI
jgi:alginate O-acetyltransferase complex protein AlgI